MATETVNSTLMTRSDAQFMRSRASKTALPKGASERDVNILNCFLVLQKTEIVENDSAKRNKPMHLPNLSRLEWLLIGLSTLFLFTAPFNNSMFPDSAVLRAQSALWLVVASGAVIFGGKYRWLALGGLFVVILGLLFTTYMKSFGLESITNDEKYSSILGGEKLNFGSTPWFIFGAAINLAVAAVALRLTRGGIAHHMDTKIESLPEV